MAMFNGYVNLPEGRCFSTSFQPGRTSIAQRSRALASIPWCSDAYQIGHGPGPPWEAAMVKWRAGHPKLWACLKIEDSPHFTPPFHEEKNHQPSDFGFWGLCLDKAVWSLSLTIKDMFLGVPTFFLFSPKFPSNFPVIKHGSGKISQQCKLALGHGDVPWFFHEFPMIFPWFSTIFPHVSETNQVQFPKKSPP